MNEEKSESYTEDQNAKKETSGRIALMQEVLHFSENRSRNTTILTPSGSLPNVDLHLGENRRPAEADTSHASESIQQSGAVKDNAPQRMQKMKDLDDWIATQHPMKQKDLADKIIELHEAKEMERDAMKESGYDDMGRSEREYSQRFAALIRAYIQDNEQILRLRKRIPSINNYL